MSTCLRLVLAVLLLIACANTSSAGWDQAWQSDVASVDHIQAQMLLPGAWSNPAGIDTFLDWDGANWVADVLGWQQTYNDGTYLIADGPAVSTLRCTLHLATDQSQPFSFLYQEWNGDTLLETRQYNWPGQGDWTWEDATWDTPRITPEPTAFGLLALGVVLLARRRR